MSDDEKAADKPSKLPKNAPWWAGLILASASTGGVGFLGGSKAENAKAEAALRDITSIKASISQIKADTSGTNTKVVAMSAKVAMLVEKFSDQKACLGRLEADYRAAAMAWNAHLQTSDLQFSDLRRRIEKLERDAEKKHK